SALNEVLEWGGVSPQNMHMLRQKAYILYRLKKYDELTEVYGLGKSFYPEEPSFCHTEALKYFDSENYEAALRAVAKEIKNSPNFLAFHTLAAECSFKLGNYSDAISYTRSALNIYPYLVDMYYIQAKIYYDVSDFKSVVSVANSVEAFNYFHDDIMFYKAMSLNALGELEESKNILGKLIEGNGKEAKYYSEMSKTLSRQGNNKEAVVYIDEAIGLTQETDALMRCYLSKARYFRLMEEYNKAFKKYKVIQESNSPLKIFGYNDEGLLYLNLKKYEEAIVDFEQVIKLDPQTLYGYSNLADCYYNLKDYEKALEFYEKQLQYTEEGHLYTSRGLCYYYLGEVGKERENYLKSIEVDPDYAYAYNNMGYILYCENNYNEAIEYYLKAIEKKDNLLSAHRYLGDSYRDLRQFDKSIEVFNGALKIFTNGKEKRLLLEDKAFVYYHTHRYREAIAIFKSALDENLESAYIYDMIGYSYYKLKEYHNALGYYEKGIGLYKEYNRLYVSFGDYYYEVLNDYKKALKYYSDALKLEDGGKDYKRVLKIAKCYEKLGNGKLALENYESALKLLQEDFEKSKEPERACYYLHYGQIYLGLNNFDRAMHYFNLAIEKAKVYGICFTNKCGAAYYGIGNTYKKLGDINKALEYYDKAIGISDDDEYLNAKKALMSPKKKSIFDIFKK
ncbi:MAG: tetratricopeptide repeat protein, partial [Clostridiales bacterium]|nr:tetratricopeptide repeat protein [Clostridiales bacterium]